MSYYYYPYSYYYPYRYPSSHLEPIPTTIPTCCDPPSSRQKSLPPDSGDPDSRPTSQSRALSEDQEWRQRSQPPELLLRLHSEDPE